MTTNNENLEMAATTIQQYNTTTNELGIETTTS
jgi:hypothetical protein